ncbi:hypothetical protein L1987_40410 [Smallanthus sonchifolius]|uniref:Uncharacterized protein n=1 Tax=Smallanthus sonchifolius TaxID=185202 RepID=A0ACB9GT69_9ASTR|nr:hypothetical protein L1987_40410 [Smallanthus sonchifolius]
MVAAMSKLYEVVEGDSVVENGLWYGIGTGKEPEDGVVQAHSSDGGWERFNSRAEMAVYGDRVVVSSRQIRCLNRALDSVEIFEGSIDKFQERNLTQIHLQVEFKLG